MSCRGVAWWPDPDCNAAASAHFGKTIFIGCVVADKDRAASKKRRFGKKGGDRRALVCVMGLELDNHLAFDQTERGTCIALKRFGIAEDFLFPFRRCAINITTAISATLNPNCT